LTWLNNGALVVALAGNAALLWRACFLESNHGVEVSMRQPFDAGKKEAAMFQPPHLSRRHFIAGITLAPLVPLPVMAAPERLRLRRTLMGTLVDITVADAGGKDVAFQVEQAFNEMQRLERLMSRFDAASQVSQINQEAGRASVAVAPELMAVLQTARQRARLTQGAFDPALGQLTAQADLGAARLDDAQRRRYVAHADSRALELDAQGLRARLTDPLARLDLGGVAKLPILAAGLRCLEQAGVSGCLVNGGGDVLATARADGQPWRIGIRDACFPDRLLGIVALPAGVVASSGDYERFVMVGGQRLHHIIDPRSGRPTAGLHGLTMVAERPEQVNALGPATMVAGPAQAMARLQAWGTSRSLLMRADGHTEISAALRASLQPPPDRPTIRGLAA
jgi:thiamine biosynthesis lipoprotein